MEEREQGRRLQRKEEGEEENYGGKSKGRRRLRGKDQGKANEVGKSKGRRRRRREEHGKKETTKKSNYELRKQLQIYTVVVSRSRRHHLTGCDPVRLLLPWGLLVFTTVLCQ